MGKEVQPKDTTREAAYELWMKAPNPMVTFFKTLDVTNLIKFSNKKHMKFNMLLDYCIGKAAVSANSHFLRTAGPHFPDSPGHIKRTAWDISRAEGTPPH